MSNEQIEDRVLQIQTEVRVRARYHLFAEKLAKRWRAMLTFLTVLAGAEIILISFLKFTTKTAWDTAFFVLVAMTILIRVIRAESGRIRRHRQLHVDYKELELHFVVTPMTEEQIRAALLDIETKELPVDSSLEKFAQITNALNSDYIDLSIPSSESLGLRDKIKLALIS